MEHGRAMRPWPVRALAALAMQHCFVLVPHTAPPPQRHWKAEPQMEKQAAGGAVCFKGRRRSRRKGWRNWAGNQGLPSCLGPHAAAGPRHALVDTHWPRSPHGGGRCACGPGGRAVGRVGSRCPRGDGAPSYAADSKVHADSTCVGAQCRSRMPRRLVGRRWEARRWPDAAATPALHRHIGNAGGGRMERARLPRRPSAGPAAATRGGAAGRGRRGCGGNSEDGTGEAGECVPYWLEDQTLRWVSQDPVHTARPSELTSTQETRCSWAARSLLSFSS